jgi:hypothetical protein
MEGQRPFAACAADEESRLVDIEADGAAVGMSGGRNGKGRCCDDGNGDRTNPG